ncbi:glucose-6-phosphate isomerase [Marinagarivorans algicola]|uniref:glucose-6-phosphate isomerase n=1 Tax=Marinagarivorans algicola TaxID=1513270 RepID=UPI0006B8F69E|nr:glucose-6-phosphate isomerase [Marinagarivorans algicola]
MPNALANTYSNWSALEKLQAQISKRHLTELFEQDSTRAERFSASAAGLDLDFSKNHISTDILAELVKLAEQADLKGAISRIFKGEHVNNTEDRPALHSALRHIGQPENDAHKSVQETLARMEKLVARVHSKEWKGFKGEAITDVVNIGIGGSDLGPRMVTKALTPYHTGHVNLHFVANVDGAEIHDLTNSLNPATTLFIVASKSFSTQETLENALTARRWMLAGGCAENELAKHFIAISSKVDKAVDFGIAAENVYPIWDWVGGRYSLWSAIGLPIAFAVGMDNFNALRAGAYAMDKHFADAPLEKNLPALMGMMVFWYTQFFDTTAQAVLPYAYHMQMLPAYLQQLEMESNGKSVTREGDRVDYSTGSVVWGTEGTNGQHSFHQLLHQGTVLMPIDFIATLKAHHPLDHQHRLLFANCVAQSQALLTGRDLETTKAELRAAGTSEDEIERLAEHKVHPGSRPSNTLLMETLSPETLGALIAAYEHKVFTIGILSNINSFDQWGVELGKLLGNHVNDAIETTDVPGDWDSSTARLVERFCEANK